MSRSQVLMELDGVSKRFGGVLALDTITMQVYEGEILGIIGPNGSGKTTLFNLISHVMLPTQGDIRFRRKSLLGERIHHIIRHNICRTFQNIALFEHMSVRDNVLVGTHHLYACGIIASVLRTPAARREEEKAQVLVDHLMQKFEVNMHAHKPVSALPFTLRKRVELARAMAGNPDLLLLDEPAGGLTQSEVEHFVELLHFIRKEYRVTILLVEHHMGMVLNVSDRVVAFDSGKKIAEGDPASIRNHPDVIRSYLGSDL